LAGATLGALDEVVDLVDQGLQKRLVLGGEALAEGGEGDVSGFAEFHGGAAHEALALLPAVGQFCYLFIHIDIDIEKSGGILVDDAFLLPVEQVQETSIFLKLVLEHGNDLLEAGLVVHGMDDG
jgi:hypothetical protein